MGGAAGPELAAAVSNAGALGTLALSWSSPAEVTEAIEQTQALTQKPFAANFLFNSPQDERVDAALAAGAPVVSLAWGDPAALIPRIREAGARVLATVGTAAEARHAAGAGADVVVAQGWEAGGHVWGTVATLALVPAVVDAVAPVPVIAAGGIADGRGLAAALMLGAQGALIGTRFLATPEARGNGHSKDVILNALGSQTMASKFYDNVLGLVWPGAMVRTINHPLLDEWGERPHEWTLAADQLRPALKAAVSAGDFVLAGESAGLVHDIVPAGVLVGRIARQAKELLD